MNYADDWGSIGFLNETSDGFEYYDSISVSTHNTLPFEINASALVMDTWGMFYPEGKHYIPEVGILGLGPYFGAPYILMTRKSWPTTRGSCPS